MSWIIRAAGIDDLDALARLENDCFKTDRLSKRSFRRHILSEHSDIVIASSDKSEVLAYGLALKHRGTRLARLYSLAVDSRARGQGIAKQLIDRLERLSSDDERHYMRLEVAKQNQEAIALYERCGYCVFGEYLDYYDDHTDALRMHKRIRQIRESGVHRPTPWLAQRTDFTCGPATLMMAMASINAQQDVSLEQELLIWREATTIFMTSGHGGCHPFGLALAAQSRGFKSEVWLNTEQTLFADGVRGEHKKHILDVVHQQFLRQCYDKNVAVHYQAMNLSDIYQHLDLGCAVLILVSTYRLDGKKAPHWVVVTGMDEHCLFVHDPDINGSLQSALDCQYVPIAKDDFDKMAAFGSLRLRAALTVSSH